MSTQPSVPWDFPRYWQSVRARTMKVAAAVPEDLIGWGPGHGAMSFGDLLRHLSMTERWMFTETALGRSSRYQSHGPEVAASKGEILELMQRCHLETVTLLERLQPEDLSRAIETPAGARIACWKWLRAMAEHEVHHRGQLYLMLRMCDVPTPPIFGLTSEELRRRGSMGAAPESLTRP